MGPWTVESETAVYDNPWIRVIDFKVIRPDGAPGQYGVVHYKNLAIGVLPLLDDGTVPLVGQHRFPLDAYSWELPEGGGKREVDPLSSAKRELAEETGFRARHWLKFSDLDLSNSVTDERSVCYLAWGLEAGEAEPEADEILAHKRVKFSALHEMVLGGDIRDSLTIIMVLTAKALALAGRLPEEPQNLILGSVR
ncbi:MAG: NUDIX hydrolase [Parvularculaceae bacterium]|nr:NUDIX hydrolase [Parvularculaceae bacterium]